MLKVFSCELAVAFDFFDNEINFVVPRETLCSEVYLFDIFRVVYCGNWLLFHLVG